MKIEFVVDDTPFKKGEKYFAKKFQDYYEIESSKGHWRVSPENVKEIVQETSSSMEHENNKEMKKSLDGHYNFSYNLSLEDVAKGYIKLDPYFVSSQWKLGSKDESGALWHIFKTIARFGEKNDKEREMKAMMASLKRLAQILNVDLEDGK